MHPISTALFILGYALALPIAAKMSTVVERQARLGLLGHQLGIMIALLGWLMRGSIFVAIAHGLWLAIAYAWFTYLGPQRSSAASRLTTPRKSRTGRSSRRGDSNG